MKTIKKFPLTTVIKNVQSTTRKVGMFALNNIEYVLVGIGIIARIAEMVSGDFTMPTSFYTDTTLNMFLLWGWIKYQTADNKILKRRLAICALNAIIMWNNYGLMQENCAQISNLFQ